MLDGWQKAGESNQQTVNYQHAIDFKSEAAELNQLSVNWFKFHFSSRRSQKDTSENQEILLNRHKFLKTVSGLSNWPYWQKSPCFIFSKFASIWSGCAFEVWHFSLLLRIFCCCCLSGVLHSHNDRAGELGNVFWNAHNLNQFGVFVTFNHLWKPSLSL